MWSDGEEMRITKLEQRLKSGKESDAKMDEMTWQKSFRRDKLTEF